MTDTTAELRAEIDKLVRWHREDAKALEEMRSTIQRLRAELATANARLDATARLAGRQETKLRKFGAPATVDAVTVRAEDTHLQLPRVEGPEYAPCTTCGHIEPEHQPDAGPCGECDCGAYSPARP
jgi:hypothetical protein